MGRRKQLKPTRLADEEAAQASTSDSPVDPPAVEKPPNGTPKKTPTDFSISAHLRTSPPEQFKQQQEWMKAMGFNGNSLNSMAMNPFVGFCTPADFFSAFAQPKKRSHNKTARKKKRTSPKESEEPNGDTAAKTALERLSSLVTTVGNSPSAIANIMRAHNSALRSDAPLDPSRVFTCLQCFEQFDSMESLSNHMKKTLHYNQKALTGRTSS
ncbi:hypothetical protein M3Y99_00969800 [Aphelenchoides fujianensis]|nr:hypothetical protein M3Y99_00969800 [Aphelenchoides fujianensis]